VIIPSYCFARIVGIQTSTDARFYALSAKFPESFSTEGKTLVVQFTVKHEQTIDCGGGYVKVCRVELVGCMLDTDCYYYVAVPQHSGPGENAWRIPV
jgi:calreticulin